MYTNGTATLAATGATGALSTGHMLIGIFALIILGISLIGLARRRKARP